MGSIVTVTYISQWGLDDGRAHPENKKKTMESLMISELAPSPPQQ
jgi:hypothetical protein